MTLEKDIIDYLVRWAVVEAVVAEKRRTASAALRWKQLNAACAMAIGLGFRHADTGETGVFERWAKLKEKAAGQTSRA